MSECDAVRARAENMLPSSLNTPAGAALLSSEPLNVLTLPTPSATVVEAVLDNEDERDGDEDGGEEDDDDSDNDLEIVVESQVLWTVQALHQEGLKHRTNRPRPY